MNWKGCGRKRSWPNSKCYPRINLVEMRKTWKASVGVPGLRAEIRTRDLTNTKQGSTIEVKINFTYIPMDVWFCFWTPFKLTKGFHGVLDWKLTFFTDGASFHLGGHINAQNSRNWSSINPTQTFEVTLHDQKIGALCTIATTRTVRTGVLKTLLFMSRTATYWASTIMVNSSTIYLHSEMHFRVQAHGILAATRDSLPSADDGGVSDALAEGNPFMRFECLPNSLHKLSSNAALYVLTMTTMTTQIA
jgi:hypothetical protein